MRLAEEQLYRKRHSRRKPVSQSHGPKRRSRRTAAGCQMQITPPFFAPYRQKKEDFFMSEKKVGKRLLTWVLVLVMTLSLLPLNVLAEETAPSGNVKYGTIGEDGKWTETPNDTGTNNITGITGVKSVSKTAEPAKDEDDNIISNQYEVTLKVELEQTTSTTPPGAAATALVLDCSGSMKYCMKDAHTHDSTCYEQIKTECTRETNKKHWKKKLFSDQYSHIDRSPCVKEDGKYYFYKQGDLICTKTEGHVHNDKCGANGNSRMDAAKKASIDFLKVYSGFAATDFNENGSLKSSAADKSLSRYVAVIRFSDALDNDPSWVDVSTVNGYTQAFEAIVNARAEGGTNLDAGLRKASDLMEVSPVAGISAKNVIALTDGEPTYYQYYYESQGLWDYDTGWYTGGQGNYCDEYTYNTTKDSATTLKSKSVELYTVCFSAVGEKMKNGWTYRNGWTYWDTTVDRYLATEIATDANHAKTAKTADELNTVFAAITDTIVSGLNSGTVTDRLPAGVTFKNGTPDGFTSENGAYKWELSGATGMGENGKTVYTYTKTYTVTIDPETAEADKDGYVPLNGKTTLTVEGCSVDFPIPAGKVTPKTMTLEATSYTGKYDGQKHEVTAKAMDDGQELTGVTYKYSTDEGTTWVDTVPSATDVTDSKTVLVRAEKRGYNTVEQNCTLTITPVEIELKADSDSREYDGTELVKNSYTINTGAFVGDEGLESVTVTGSQTNAGSSDNEITDYKLKDNTKAGNYNITTEAGTLTITPVAIELTANSDSKKYDGTALTADGYTISNGSFVGEEGLASVDVEGSQTEVGLSDNTIKSHTLKNNTLAENYTITYKPGTLQVTTNDTALTISGTNNSYTYDGNDHGSAAKTNISGAEIQYSIDDGITWSSDVPTIKNVGKITVKANATLAGYKDVTCSYTLEVTPRPVTVTAHNVNLKVGDSLPKEYTAHVSGMVDGEKPESLIEYSVTAASDASTATAGTYDITPSGEEFQGNYKVTYQKGTLNVSDKTNTVTVNFKIVGGTWDDDDTIPKSVEVTLTNGEGSLANVAIPTGKPDGEHEGTGTWSNNAEISGDPSPDTVITQNTTFTLTFDAKETEPPTPGTIQLGEFICKNFESRYGASTEETFYAYATVTPFFVYAPEQPGQSEQQPGQSEQQPGQSEQQPGQSEQQPGQSEQQPATPSETPEPEVIEVSDSLTLDDGLYEYEGSVTLNAGYSKQFTFAEVSLPAGMYRVEVYERDDGKDNIVYDDTTYFFTLTVVEKDGGTVASAGDFVSCAEGNGELVPMENATKVEFTNEYTYRRPHHPRPKPTVEIKDDDALGLNTTDHFAYIVGYGNGEVRPQNNITRAEVATIFFRLLTDDVRDENLTKTNRYSDVTRADWYNTAVSTLSSMGIITGYPDGTFRPNAAITRAEFAAIAARFDHDGDKTAAKFSDIATHWAKDEISIAYNNGWITGYPDGTFGPQRDITRAETMTLVNRVLNRQPETEEDLLPNMTVWTDNANPKAWYYLAVQEATNSHYYEFKTNSQYEKWTELRETRDWTQLEK